MNEQKFKIYIISFLLYNLLFISTILVYFKSRNFTEFKDLDDELVNIQQYINIVFNNTLIDGDKIFPLTNNPKISIIITVFNGEAYLKTSILSIKNQDLKNIEIILVDDCSTDKSVKLIKEMMSKDPRIILYQNEKNRGMLYTKTKGVLSAKGKYVFLLDEDDMIVQREALSTLYREAESNNLDLLGFKLIHSKPKLKIKKYERTYIDNPVIFQPELSEMMFKHISDGKIKKIGGLLTNYLIKKNILIKVIKQLDHKLLNEKINFHDDFLLFFLLTRNAYKLKQIDRIFYLVLFGWNRKNKKVKFRMRVKNRNRKYMRCNNLLTFNEFVLKNTKNTFYDKKVAFFCLDQYLLSYWCRNFKPTHEKAIKVSNLFLNNKYIEEEDKRKIIIFINETNNQKII